MAQEKKKVQTQNKSEQDPELEDAPKTLAGLERLAQKLVKEGRMPSPEVFDKVMAVARKRRATRH
jgi:hypothetical protein